MVREFASRLGVAVGRSIVCPLGHFSTSCEDMYCKRTINVFCAALQYIRAGGAYPVLCLKVPGIYDTNMELL